MKRPSISLVISTYNRPDALRLCLESVRRQRRLPLEVIVADDGSRDETRRLVTEMAEDFPVPLIHVWQEDKGFRLSKIRNRAMMIARGKYIVQTDGDMILHRSFIADHARFARRDSYTRGVRAKMSPALTAQYEGNPSDAKCPGPFSKGVGKRMRAVRFIPLAWWFASFFKKDQAYGLGCNMGFFKEDFIAVNGYEEIFTGWGCEDDDMAARLHRLGRKMRDLHFSAVCYHLWHPENPRDDIEERLLFMKEREKRKTVRAEKGLEQYTEDLENA